MTGINTRDNAAAIKATIYSGQLRAQLEPELIAMNYVDMITDPSKLFLPSMQHNVYL